MYTEHLKLNVILDCLLIILEMFSKNTNLNIVNFKILNIPIIFAKL